MDETINFDSSVVVIPGRPGSHALDKLEKQDYLYHVNLQGLLGGEIINSTELITVISRGVNPYSEFDEYLKLAEQPSFRFIISNTTEAGIVFDESCGFHDRPASSFPAKLTQLLYRRFTTFSGDSEKGFIIMPCELIFHNGTILKDCINKYIDLWKEELGADYSKFRDWFNTSCYVCSTLVDRIVPGFPADDIQKIQQSTGFEDKLAVRGEPYHLWVIEHPSNMTAQKLTEEFPAEKAGLNVIITDSEGPFHERKVTLLNGPHTLLAPVAFLSGVDIVRDACNHPVIGAYIRKVQFEELMPSLELPREELRDYAEGILERFNNPYVDHKTESIMLNAFPKFATRDLPRLLSHLKRNGTLPEGIVFGLAAIVKYYQGGKRKDGTEIIPQDNPQILTLMSKLWSNGDSHKVAQGILASDLIWSDQGNLNEIPGLTGMLAGYLDLIEEKGMLEALKTII